MSDHHPAIRAGETAVVAGAAGGLGLAAWKLAGLGLNLWMADRNGPALGAAADAIRPTGAVQNRPPLSRWRSDWRDRFAAYMAAGDTPA